MESSVTKFAEELRRYLRETRERVTENLKTRPPAQQLLYFGQHSLVAQREGLKACGPLCAVLSTYFAPIILYNWTRDRLAGRIDSVWRAGFFGGYGSGKTTYGFLIVLAWYLATRGYCRVHMPEVRGVGEVLPPSLDCSIDPMQEPVPEVERAVVYDKDGLRRVYEENRAARMAGRYPPIDAILLDEGGVSAFGSSTYHTDRELYAYVSKLAQLIRTTVPFSIVTAPDERALSRYMRKAVYVVVNMAVDPLRPDVVRVRMDAVTEPRGIYRLELIQLLRDFVLRPDPHGVKTPDWFYERHMKWRDEVVEKIYREIEERERRAEERKAAEDGGGGGEDYGEEEYGEPVRRRRRAEYDF